MVGDKKWGRRKVAGFELEHYSRWESAGGAKLRQELRLGSVLFRLKWPLPRAGKAYWLACWRANGTAWLVSDKAFREARCVESMLVAPPAEVEVHLTEVEGVEDTREGWGDRHVIASI